MSIDAMIDAVVRCVCCGAPRAARCRCWVTLRCERCSARTTVEREPEDGDVDEIVTLCPKCGDT